MAPIKSEHDMYVVCKLLHLLNNVHIESANKSKKIIWEHYVGALTDKFFSGAW